MILVFFFKTPPTTETNPTGHLCPQPAAFRSEGLPQAQGIESGDRDFRQAWLETVVAGDTEAALATLTEMLREGDLPPPATDPAGVEATRPQGAPVEAKRPICFKRIEQIHRVGGSPPAITSDPDLLQGQRAPSPIQSAESRARKKGG